jgi:hypothetical protein
MDRSKKIHAEVTNDEPFPLTPAHTHGGREIMSHLTSNHSIGFAGLIFEKFKVFVCCPLSLGRGLG